ncbi:MAG TPA: indole-3-glycerol-phosphate synthase TrpC [Desulfotomaculum sp.]|nr:MAG: Indole-3-glycerol-phosphate synthase [Desulfotomaculum sp. 46_80]HAG11475.1 indole-3-glycerol-phosphate synthase TrpC [Desulfotomaculum sp.]HBY03092.1 indole-3-glycerol-phosphate synthase TrpC [Desulfotomaculum sp.]
MDRAKRFSAALWRQYHSGKVPVIPDIKSRSPQEGGLLLERDPAAFARALAAAGAPAVSVVTEPEYFGGSTELLKRITQAVSLPVLRKDFINRRAQLEESVELGTAAVLLIASMLEKDQLAELVEDALTLGLEPLVETHTQAEIINANQLSLTMLGINNRNIVELELDGGNVGNTEKLTGLVRPDVLIISESSISSSEDVQRALRAGAHAVLVGTAILRAEDPPEMFRCLSETRMENL